LAFGQSLTQQGPAGRFIVPDTGDVNSAARSYFRQRTVARSQGGGKNASLFLKLERLAKPSAFLAKEGSAHLDQRAALLQRQRLIQIQHLWFYTGKPICRSDQGLG